MLASICSVPSGNQTGRGAKRAGGVATNTVSITNLQRSSDTGDVSISWSLASAAPVLISWSDTAASSSVTSPYFVAADTYSAVLPAFTNLLLSSIVFTVTVTNSKGNIKSKYEASATLTVPGIVFDLTVMDQTNLRSFALSKSTGQYILAGNENGVYVSTDFGTNFSRRSSSAPFGANNCSAYISDDGQTIILCPSTPAVATGRIYVSQTGGVTFFAVNIAADNFSLCGMCFSAGGEYIFASGSGTNGGLYRSTNKGSSFTKVLTEVNAAGCDCSPNGRTVVVAVPNALSWISYDYGATSYNFGPSNYPSKRPYLHPKENYVAVRSVDAAAAAQQGFLYTKQTIDDAQITGTIEYVTGTHLTAAPGDVDSCGAIDVNGRFYFVDTSISRLKCFTTGDFRSASLQTVPRLQDVAFTDARIQVTPGSGQYILGLNEGKLRLVKQHAESNAVIFDAAPSINENGSGFISWSFSSPRGALISWTPTTANQAQPVKVASSSTTSYLFGASSFMPYVDYYFTVSALDMSGNVITTESTYPTAVQYAPSSRTPSDVTGTTCYTMAISSQGKHVLVITSNGVFYSSNYGVKFSNTNGTYPFLSTQTCLSFISNDGGYIYLSRYGTTVGSTFYYSLDQGKTFGSKNLPAPTINISSMCASADGKYVFFTASGGNGGIFVYQNYITATSTGVRAVNNGNATGCSCSADGSTIIVGINLGAPFVSYNFGTSFANFVSGTTYKNTRSYVHPDGTWFNLRSTTPDAFLYPDLWENRRITATTNYTGTNANVALLSSDVAERTFIEYNGRIYFVHPTDLNYLYYLDSFSMAITKVPNLDPSVFTDLRLSGSQNGRFVANYSDGKLYLLNFWTETNDVQNLSATLISQSFTVTGSSVELRWRTRRNDRKTRITWTTNAFNATTSTITYSAEIAPFSDTKYTITGLAPVDKNTLTMNFTVCTLNGTGTFVTSIGTAITILPGWPKLTPTFSTLTNVYSSTERTIYTAYEMRASAIEFSFDNTGMIDLFMVGGGGAGGKGYQTPVSPGGGGGGGEVVYGRYFVTANIWYIVTIGNGGFGGSGGNTKLSLKTGGDLIVALGGGVGGNGQTATKTGVAGGSSGGAGYNWTTQIAGRTGTPISAFNDAQLVRLAGMGDVGTTAGGGAGGGASLNGKEGYRWYIDNQVYGSGGGGGANGTGKTTTGGTNAGYGSFSSRPGDGLANRGGGGGGGGSNTTGNGGSGTVKFAVFT